VATPTLPQQILFRDAGIGEAQRMRVGGVPADLVVRGLDAEAGRAVGHDDRRDLFAPLTLPRDRRHRHEAGYWRTGVRDELLRAVDDPLTALEHRAGAGRAGIR